MIQKVKGTQDFINLDLYNFIINQTKKHLLEYNFNEIKLPILEYTELFQRTLGSHTDIISKEMFLIDTKGKSDNEQICLRPEATASTARAFLDSHIENLPWKVFTFGPMFRYERPQKGRYREFNQISIEVIGSNSISQDALFIKMLDQYFKEKLFLDNYALAINFLGCQADRIKFEEILKTFLNSVSDKICSDCSHRKDKNPLRIFDCKKPNCQEIYIQAPKTTDYLCDECKQEWEQLQSSLELISISFVHNPKLVRGLDYYDKTVFEFTSANLGAQNAFCGGGRYNRLISEISQDKQSQPAIGAAIGIERLLILLEEIKDKLPLEQKKPLYVILPLSNKQTILALLISNLLHANNITSDVILDESSVKSMMRKANKMGAKFIIIIGEDEQAKNEVTMKNMLSGTEDKVKQSEIINYIKKF